MDRGFLTQKRGVSIPPSSREPDVYKGRHHGTSRASDDTHVVRTGTRRHHCILVQTFGMEFYPYDVKQHVKSAAKQIPERERFVLWQTSTI